MYKILALTVKPQLAPETRYRILQYREPFQARGIEIQHQSLLSEAAYRWHLRGQRAWLQALLYPFFFLRRLLKIMWAAPRSDAVWISRELSPVGRPWLERLALRLGQWVVLDIDDSVFLPDQAVTSLIHHRLRDFDKFRRLGGRYVAVVCGNNYLSSYFRPLNPNVHVIPTVVPLARYQAITRRPSPVVRVGWVGTPWNHLHLDLLKPVLRCMRSELNFQVVIVGLPELPGWDLDNLTCLEWELDRELDYFALFDIGVMPLQEFEFAKGKCAFKLIQYMAAGIPVVASPVGANAEVIQDGHNGLLASSEEEWVDKLRRLITDSDLRQRIGEAGRETVRQHYCLEKWGEIYAQIFLDMDPKDGRSKGR